MFGSFPYSDIAPAGHYLALRVGFAFPMFEQNALPEEWVKIYTAQGLMLYDPVMQWMYGNIGSARWSQIEIDDPRGIMRQANGFGLNYGVAISCLDVDQTGQRSFGTFARSDREFTDDEIAQLDVQMLHLHNAKAPPTNLTDAEKEVLGMVKNGMLLKQIANELAVSEGAIKQRLRNAKYKLDARNSTQAATIALEFGLI